jgi:hypothetical protein
MQGGMRAVPTIVSRHRWLASAVQPNLHIGRLQAAGPEPPKNHVIIGLKFRLRVRLAQVSIT